MNGYRVRRVVAPPDPYKTPFRDQVWAIAFHEADTHRHRMDYRYYLSLHEAASSLWHAFRDRYIEYCLYEEPV